jgi:ComEC/Rec2-related protein
MTSSNSNYSLPAILAYLIAWIAGILLSEGLIVCCTRFASCHPQHDLSTLLMQTAFGCLLMGYLLFCLLRIGAARRSSRSASTGRALSLLLLVAGVAFIKALSDHAAPPQMPTAEWTEPFRAWCMHCFDSYSPTSEQHALIQSMLLGDRGALSYAMRQNFGNAGMGHLMAVSGLHLALIYGFVYGVFYLLRFLVGRRWVRLLALVALYPYVFLIGAPPSAVRALLILTLLFGAQHTQSVHDNARNCTLVALLMLMVNTRLLFNVSFQLSFLAVTILLGTPQPNYEVENREVERHARMLGAQHGAWAEAAYTRFCALRRRVGQLLLVALNIQLLMMPLSLHYFHHLTVFGFLHCLLVLPFMGAFLALLILLLLMHALYLFFPTCVGGLWVAHCCWLCIDLASRWILFVADHLNRLDLMLFGDVRWNPSATAVLLSYLALLLYWAGYHRRRPAYWVVALICVAAIICIG